MTQESAPSVGVQTVFVRGRVGDLEREVARLKKDNLRLVAMINRLRFEKNSSGNAVSSRFLGSI
jgi:hypothetical protein